MGIALISVYGVKEPTSSMYYHKLYNLLAEREPWQNISHKVMPSWEDHVKFVSSRPYKAWYVIFDNADFVGAVYLTNNNEIGIHIRKSCVRRNYGKNAIKALIKTHKEKYYLANIGPNNSHSIAFFANNGFKYESKYVKNGDIVQYIYKFIPARSVSSKENIPRVQALEQGFPQSD